jgi:hypothetical protein
MKTFRLLPVLITVMGLNIASLPSAQASDLGDIITNYCEEVGANVDDTLRGLENAAQDLSRCDNKLDDCTSGVFGSNAASCFVDFGSCIVDGGEDAVRECSEFTRELAEDTRHAQDRAARDGVGREFEQWFIRAFANSGSCLAPARQTSVVCSGSQ